MQNKHTRAVFKAIIKMPSIIVSNFLGGHFSGGQHFPFWVAFSRWAIRPPVVFVI